VYTFHVTRVWLTVLSKHLRRGGRILIFVRQTTVKVSQSASIEMNDASIQPSFGRTSLAYIGSMNSSFVRGGLSWLHPGVMHSRYYSPVILTNLKTSRAAICREGFTCTHILCSCQFLKPVV